MDAENRDEAPPFSSLNPPFPFSFFSVFKLFHAHLKLPFHVRVFKLGLVLSHLSRVM